VRNPDSCFYDRGVIGRPYTCPILIRLEFGARTDINLDGENECMLISSPRGQSQREEGRVFVCKKRTDGGKNWNFVS